jgi:ABC-2 type transport system ATP-binding protein
VSVNPDRLAAARALGPLRERQALGRSELLFDGVERTRLEALGEVRAPSIAELFVAVVGGQAAQARGAAS